MLTSHFSHGILKQKIELDPEKWEMGLKQEFPFSKYPPLKAPVLLAVSQMDDINKPSNRPTRRRRKDVVGLLN